MRTILLEVRSGSLDAPVDALGVQSLACHLEDPTQIPQVSMWVWCWTKWCDRVFYEYFCFLLYILFNRCSICMLLLLPEIKWAKPANIPNNNALSEIAEHWVENTSTFLSSTVVRTNGRSLGACIQSNAFVVIGEHCRGHYFQVVF